MKKTDLSIETDRIWIKFADLLVETGVISDCIDNRAIQVTLQENMKKR